MLVHFTARNMKSPSPLPVHLTNFAGATKAEVRKQAPDFDKYQVCRGMFETSTAEAVGRCCRCRARSRAIWSNLRIARRSWCTWWVIAASRSDGLIWIHVFVMQTAE